jgi:hypothetical protein
MSNLNKGNGGGLQTAVDKLKNAKVAGSAHLSVHEAAAILSELEILKQADQLLSVLLLNSNGGAANQ